MTPFNLLKQKWIPIRRRSGLLEWIGPHDVTSRALEDPIVALACPRLDFNGALIQFLIALIQTSFAPADKRMWRHLLKSAPRPQELQKAFEPWEPAFNLDGDGPRFMQDFDAQIEVGAEPVKINRLLISEPGEQSEKLNKDHFIRRNMDPCMSLPAAAMALMCLQMNAPSGGQGHRTSLRGGGPLTTLVCGGTLWEDIWSNVVEPERIDYDAQTLADARTQFFPWIAPTRTSENDEKVEPTSAHPLLHFWACPRRIRLQFKNLSRRCDIFPSVEVSRGCVEYVTKNYGSNYSENWIHPLTPYRKNKDGQSFFSVKTPGNGLSFQHWLGLIAQVNGALPALVIQRLQAEHNGGVARIRCFGYAMDNMKPLNWIESEFPLYVFDDPEREKRYSADLASLVLAAREVWILLRKSIQEAQPEQAPLSSTKAFEKLERHYNNLLESKFFSVAGGLTEVADDGRIEAKQKWLVFLQATALDVFDSALLTGDVAGMDLSRVFGGRAHLRALLRKARNKVEGILELPLSRLESDQAKGRRKTTEKKELAP